MRIDQLKSGGSFRERQYCVYEPQNSQNIRRQASKTEYNFVFQRMSISLNCYNLVSWPMDSISAFVLHSGNLRLFET